MNADISLQSMKQLGHRITRHLGLRFSEERLTELNRKLRPAAGDFGFHDTAQFLEWLTLTPWTEQHVRILARYLAVGESYFFRHRTSFEMLRRYLQHKSKRQHLTIWSAGCSRGEEPYSIAMFLNQMGLGWFDDVEISIVGTDINDDALTQAKAGIYRPWSLRSLSRDIIDKYFTQTGNGNFQVIHKIRNRIKFQYCNLVDDDWPPFLPEGALDVIFCRNVLMYFDAGACNRVLDRFHRASAEGGWLMVAPAEIGLVAASRYASVFTNGSIAYEKSQLSLSRKSTQPSKSQASSPRPAIKANALANRGFEEALELWGQGRIPAALEHMAQYLATKKGIPEGFVLGFDEMMLVARSYANLGELAEAQSWLKRAVTVQKASPDPYYWLAIVSQEAGDFNQAKDFLRTVLFLDPNYLMAHFLMATIHRQEGRTEEAERHLDYALEVLDSMGKDSIIEGAEAMTADDLKRTIVSSKNGRDHG